MTVTLKAIAALEALEVILMMRRNRSRGDQTALKGGDDSGGGWWYPLILCLPLLQCLPRNHTPRQDFSKPRRPRLDVSVGKDRHAHHLLDSTYLDKTCRCFCCFAGFALPHLVKMRRTVPSMRRCTTVSCMYCDETGARGLTRASR